MTPATPTERSGQILRTAAHTVPVVRSSRERATLGVLLQAATTAEQTVGGPAQREAYRTTRSLLAAARALGFTLADLAMLLSVTDGAVRTRSGVLIPIAPSTFLALVPTLEPEAAAAGIWDPEPLEETPVDPRTLIAWYLATPNAPTTIGVST